MEHTPYIGKYRFKTSDGTNSQRKSGVHVAIFLEILSRAWMGQAGYLLASIPSLNSVGISSKMFRVCISKTLFDFLLYSIIPFSFFFFFFIAIRIYFTSFVYSQFVQLYVLSNPVIQFKFYAPFNF